MRETVETMHGLIATSEESSCIRRTRKSLHQEFHTFSSEISLRSIALGTCFGDAGSANFVLRSSESGNRTIGEIGVGEGLWRDPVAKYLVVLLCDGTSYEAVVFRENLTHTIMYRNGTQVGIIVKKDLLSKKANFIRRLFCRKVRWNVFRQGACFGKIDIQYPINRNTKVQFRSTVIPDVSFSLARTYREKETRFIIPPSLPELRCHDEYMLFLLISVFRLQVLEMEFVSGT